MEVRGKAEERREKRERKKNPWRKWEDAESRKVC